MLLRKQAVKWYITFSQYVTSASALPGETESQKIASFHLKAEICFASRHRKHIHIITCITAELPFILTRISTKQDLQSEYSMLLSVTTHSLFWPSLSWCRSLCQKWELFFVKPQVKSQWTILVRYLTISTNDSCYQTRCQRQYYLPFSNTAHACTRAWCVQHSSTAAQRKLKSALVISYNLRPGNGTDLFLRKYICKKGKEGRKELIIYIALKLTNDSGHTTPPPGDHTGWQYVRHYTEYAKSVSQPSGFWHPASSIAMPSFTHSSVVEAPLAQFHHLKYLCKITREWPSSFIRYRWSLYKKWWIQWFRQGHHINLQTKQNQNLILYRTLPAVHKER